VSVLAFIGVGAACALTLRALRGPDIELHRSLIAGVSGATSAGLIAAAIAHEGPWHQVFPTGLLFAGLGAVLSVLWLWALSGEGETLVTRPPPL
jgi:multisubunit Na+/H+ antiporter MnhB subunit